YRDLPDLHSFPTRRSSDLAAPGSRNESNPRENARTWRGADEALSGLPLHIDTATRCFEGAVGTINSTFPLVHAISECPKPKHARSEEHTSELQSRSDLVCR